MDSYGHLKEQYDALREAEIDRIVAERAQRLWQPVATRPLADDPMWFYRNVGAGHEIDGPRGAREDDADWWQFWAPCEPPRPHPTTNAKHTQDKRGNET